MVQNYKSKRGFFSTYKKSKKGSTLIQCILYSCLIVFIASVSVSGQQLEHKIDSIIATGFNDDNGPGGVFLVAKKDEIIYQKAFGKSNLETDSKLSTESVFQIGSMTKQFTAVSILMLEQEGKLKVTDAVSSYIPDYPNGNNITIHHLLTHTSGIKDFTKMSGLQDIAQKNMTPAMLVDFFKNEAVEFLPGERFEYNNSGYVILGYIIELVTGKSYESYIKNEVFQKAGMLHSYYASDREIIKNRAYGYHQKEGKYVNKTHISYSIPFSSGALMSTVGDMFLWQQSLNNNTLLGALQIQKAFSRHQLMNGDTIQYGYGWHIKDIDGTISREHGGSIFGYKSMAIFIPQENIYVIGLSNCDCHSPTQIVRDISALMMKSPGEKQGR